MKLTLNDLLKNEMIQHKEKIQIIIEGEVHTYIERIDLLVINYGDLEIESLESLFNPVNQIPYILLYLKKEGE